MSKSKKSGKAAKIPQPIKIKKEKLEEDRVLHSMAHFVDDRVELVKQIFGSLKTKTITNLAPEYLKEKDMDEIQELCLNELLCLSKKRLMSVIKATKCPTDTESSEDSDVETKDEHISLEEISSGSELENGEKIPRRTTSQSRQNKDSRKPNKANTKNGNDGQMSVLELLELQARARAIRSQLALEPVTKIEVDLDDDDEKTPIETVSSTTKDPKSSRKHKKANGKETVQKSTTTTSASGSVSASSSTSTSQPEIRNLTPTINDDSKKNPEMHPPTKSRQKIKLKRNFRKQTEESEEIVNVDDIQKTPPKLKQEKRSHSPSPDVIPIEPVPETFCISDSGSDSETNLKSQQETKAKEIIAEMQEEAEDGEIVECEESNIMESTDTPIDSTKEIVLPTENENKSVTILSNEVLVKPVEIEMEIEIEMMKDEDKINKVEECNETNERSENQNENEQHTEKMFGNVVADIDNDLDADQNDDVISIEGGDLETEMSEHLAFTTKKSDDERKDDDNDVISLGSSDNEDECMRENIEESWQARYLKSSKVNKVLAVSRLGKRVRDKLKTSKHSKRETPKEDNTKEEEPTDAFKSKHEEGSVEQYKELLEISHRKS